jgi:hypothetical protein
MVPVWHQSRLTLKTLPLEGIYQESVKRLGPLRNIRQKRAKTLSAGQALDRVEERIWKRAINAKTAQEIMGFAGGWVEGHDRESVG